MSTGKLPTDRDGTKLQVPYFPGQTKVVPFSLASVMSSTLANAGSRAMPIVRVVADAACFIKAISGSALVAVTDMYLPANTVETIILQPTYNRIGVIAASGGGKLYVTEKL
jgi:hypothetical protein